MIPLNEEEQELAKQPFVPQHGTRLSGPEKAAALYAKRTKTTAAFALRAVSDFRRTFFAVPHGT